MKNVIVNTTLQHIAGSSAFSQVYFQFYSGYTEALLNTDMSNEQDHSVNDLYSAGFVHRKNTQRVAC